MRRGRGRLRGLAWFLFVWVFATLMFTASYFLTAYIYRVVGLHPSAWLSQLVTSFLGLLLSGAVMGNLARFANARGWMPERNVFGAIVEALERIAQGDFSTRLNSTSPDNQFVNVLANSVNRVALELEQMEALRQEFISNVSHEIQSPLTSIRGFAQALQNDQLSQEERRHYLAIIESESTRLSRITEDLLRLAALESERARFEPKPYRLDKQIRSLILVCEPQWSAKEVEMNIDLAALEISADEDLLSQVWMNLIHNSIKFTPQGGQVFVTLRQEGEEAVFRIRDTGIGIPPEDLPRIFERFYKADLSRTRSDGGSGLGLAIAKKIVEMHHGAIQAESSPGMGATFCVRLPVSTPSPA